MTCQNIFPPVGSCTEPTAGCLERGHPENETHNSGKKLLGGKSEMAIH